MMGIWDSFNQMAFDEVFWYLFIAIMEIHLRCNMNLVASLTSERELQNSLNPCQVVNVIL